jgi:cytochrome c-type biogenesis protein CcmH
MIAFAVAAAALAAIALAFVLRPLLGRRESGRVSRKEANVAIYKDELRELDADLAAGTLAREDYDRARMEIESRLLEDVSAGDAPVVPASRRASLVALGVAVPVLAAAIYFLTGNPGALDPSRQVPDAAHVEDMVARLAAKMREHPEDADGWKLLGRSYTVMGRFPEAVDAYAKAAERTPRDPQLLADFADALAMSRGQRMEGEPEKLVERALEIDPSNLKALALSGTAAYERGDYAKAAEIWSRMLPLVPEGSEDARAIAQNVNEARKLAGIGAPLAKEDRPQPSPKAAGGRGIRGVVRLSPELRRQVQPDDLVFVFARAAQGPPMPLAVLRRKAADLPLQFSLDDSMAMAQGLNISAFPQVVVGARISKSGNATPQPGDLQGATAPVANNASGVTVTIDTVVR